VLVLAFFSDRRNSGSSSGALGRRRGLSCSGKPAVFVVGQDTSRPALARVGRPATSQTTAPAMGIRMISTIQAHLGRLRMRCSSDWTQSIRQNTTSASSMA
jgi:hypothetical protein